MVATTNRRTGYGLLPTPTVSPYPGLLAPTKDQRREAFFTGLGNVGKSMNGGYSDRPISFMNQLNKGMGGFQEGYQGELETNRAKEMQNMQAQQQQAQMQAQEMAIAEAQRKQAQLAAQQEAAKAYFGSQGAYTPNMVDGMEQTTDLGNVAGAIKLNPLEQIQVDSGSGFGVIKNREDLKAAAATRKAELQDKIDFDAVKRFRPPPVTNINMQPGISKDYRTVKDNTGKIIGAEPIPGGKEDPVTIAKKAELKRKAEESVKQKRQLPGIRRNLLTKIDRLPILQGNVDDIKELSKSGFTSGLPGQILGPIGGTKQYELESKMKNIQSAFGLGELIRIKEAGGTFGALSDSEMTLLISSVQTLDPNLGPESLGPALDDAMMLYKRGLETAKEDFVEMYPDSGTPWNKEIVKIKGNLDPKYVKLRKGDRYQGPDNVVRIKR